MKWTHKRRIRKQKEQHLAGVLFDLEFVKSYEREHLNQDEQELREELVELREKTTEKPKKDENREFINKKIVALEQKINKCMEVKAQYTKLIEVGNQLKYQLNLLKKL